MNRIWRIERFAQVCSTQDIACARAADGEAEGFGIRADHQTGGRGRLGNLWESPPGNLYLSVLLRPAVPERRLGELAFVCAVALGQAARGFAADRDIRLKWPNDLLVDGRKAGGILIETGRDLCGNLYAVAGIGVNLVHAPQGAAALSALSDQITPDLFQAEFLRTLDHALSVWEKEGFRAIRMAWLDQATGLKHPIRVRRPDGGILTGVFEDIDDNGRLVVSQSSSGQNVSISAGEILTPACEVVVAQA